MSPAVQLPVSGVVVVLSDVSDPTFSGKITGPGMAITPDTTDGGEVSTLAPISGTTTKIYPHAHVITNGDGYSILVRLGLGTVSLGGKGFTLLASGGDTIDVGSPAIRWPSARIEAGGSNPIVPAIALKGDETGLEPVLPGHITAASGMFMTWAQTRTCVRSYQTLIAQCVAPTVIMTVGAIVSEHVARFRPVCSPAGVKLVVASVPRSHLVAHDAQQVAQAHALGQVVGQDDLFCAVGQGSPSAGVSPTGVGLVLSTSLPHAASQGDADQYRGGVHRATTQSLSDLTPDGGAPQQVVFAQPGGHPVALDVRLGAYPFDQPGEQAEAPIQIDMLVSQAVGSQGRVVGVDRGQGGPAVVLGLEGLAVVLLLEPQDTGSQHTTAGQVVVRPGLYGPQVLADGHGASPVSLQRGGAERGLVAVAYVDAVARTHALGDPPQAEQIDDVIHAQRAGVTQDHVHHTTQRGIDAAHQVFGAPRWPGPVLSLLAVHVRRGPHGDPGGEDLRAGPHIRPPGVHSDGEVVHDAQDHPRGQGFGLCANQLLADDPPQPGEEVNALGQLMRLVDDISEVRLLRYDGSALQGPMLPHQRTPQDEMLQSLALLGSEVLEVLLTGVGATGGEDDLEDLMFGLSCCVAVDRLGTEVTVLDLFEGPLHQRALGAGQMGYLRDIPWPGVERVDEATCHRQIGRAGHRRHRPSRVQRVDEQGVSSLVPQEGNELSEVVSVTGPP